jgi:energy-converting hydrogenase Eha subunit C
MCENTGRLELMYGIKLTRTQIDKLSTVLGIISGFVVVLSGQHILDTPTTNVIVGICTVLMGELIGKPGSDTKPN